MKVLIAFIVGCVIGGFCTYVINTINPDFFTIRILDDDECSDPVYAIEMKNQLLTVSGEQIQTEFNAIADKEAFFFVMPPLDGSEEYTYKVHAKYSDCKEIVTSERIVKRGWVLYESIRNGEITHKIRAR
ncbi:MAG: hypothetical protein KZQ93_11635 [Candidatus Thiodiazotropha sp. (ex Monitilora ramsayi)]|nr:hypothetical protein [Candidatus Thiodiazotropha sp. (ex Monitilora ramsayi)]